MATQIKGGFRFAPGTNPFALLRHAKTVLEPIREELVSAAVADKAAQLVHAADLTGGRPTNESPLFVAAKELADETLKGDLRGLRCRLGIADDPSTGRVHLLVRGHQDYIDAISKMDGVEEYAYWSAPERPAGVAADEWEERRVSWNRVLPGSGNFGSNMAVWHIDPDAGRTRRAARREEFEKIETHLPDAHERSRAIVRDRILTVLNDVQPQGWTRPKEAARRLEGAALLAAADEFEPVRSAVADLIEPSGWKTFGRGKPSRLHAELAVVDHMVGTVLTKAA